MHGKEKTLFQRDGLAKGVTDQSPEHRPEKRAV